MKANLSKKSAPPEKIPTPSAGADANQNAEIPPGLEFFVKLKDLPPLQQAAMVSPKFAEALKSDDAKEVTEIYAGLFWGAGVDLGVPLPAWAKTASEKFWQAVGCGFIPEIMNLQPGAIGKMVEFISLAREKCGAASPAQQAGNNLIQFTKNEAGNFSAEELKKFAEGRLAVPKIIEKGKNPSERAIVFLNIACGWRIIETLGSYAKVHKWFLDHKGISPNTDRAETAKWFREIGLPTGKPGRPKKIRTVQKPGNPVFPKNSKSGF